MTTHLKDNSLIPLNQPYSIAPWNYSGTESVASIPDNVVDWVLIELRDATDAASATAGRTFVRKTGFLLKNGSVVDLDGTSSIFSNEIFNQNMFAVIYHRNHLGILSANALTPSGDNYSYDFSSGETQVFGGSNGHKLLSPGIWGLFAGDADANGIVENSAQISEWKEEAGTSGYLKSDYNLDTQSNNSDKNDIWFNNYSKSSQIPN